MSASRGDDVNDSGYMETVCTPDNSAGTCIDLQVDAKSGRFRFVLRNLKWLIMFEIVMGGLLAIAGVNM